MQATRIGSAAMMVLIANVKHSKAHDSLFWIVATCFMVFVDFYLKEKLIWFLLANVPLIPFTILALLLVFEHAEV
jgi:hypothetical protein